MIDTWIGVESTCKLLNATFVTLKLRQTQQYGLQFKEAEDLSNFIAVVQYVVEQLGGDPCEFSR